MTAGRRRATIKTRPSDASVARFLSRIPDERRRKDALAMLDLMKKATGMTPTMWGGSIVGFGSYHYTYASGREGDWFLTGFSPRAQNLTVYIMSGFDRHAGLMGKLGKYATGQSCLYIRALDDVHLPTLAKLVRESVRHMTRKRD